MRYIDEELIPYVESENGVLDDFAYRYDINEIPTADVVPKSEVEELIRENESLAKTVNEASELIHKLRSKVEKSKSNVAREIFAEIEKLFFDKYLLGNITASLFEDEYAELKKKYTEGTE